jgi:hypothetical protein
MLNKPRNHKRKQVSPSTPLSLLFNPERVQYVERLVARMLPRHSQHVPRRGWKGREGREVVSVLEQEVLGAFTERACQIMADEGARYYLLFYPKDKPSVAAASYIAHGEAKKVDAAYKCTVREP